MNPIESPFYALLLLADSYNHSLSPPLFKGGLENVDYERKGGGWKKILKRGGSMQKGVPLLKRGAGKIKVKFS